MYIIIYDNNTNLIRKNNQEILYGYKLTNCLYTDGSTASSHHLTRLVYLLTIHR